MEGGSKGNKKENIFDLTKLVSMENEEELKKTSTEISSGDQDKLLENYVEVPQEDWDKIPKKTHIRYLRKDGNFRRGGFVRANYVSSYGDNKGKKSIQLASNMSYTKAAKWTISLDEIDKIWKKNISDISGSSGNITDTQINDMNNTIKNNTELIEHLTKVVEQLKIDNARISNDQTRLLNLIRKLHPKRRPT